MMALGLSCARRGGVVALSAVLLLSPMATAQDAALQSLDTWGLSRGWEGVGLLNIAGRATCTGVMIEPDLVLTAAHCLVDQETGEKPRPSQVEFRAGWRDGAAIATRFGKAAIIHPDYLAARRENGDKIRVDLGLLQLSSPIQATHANPFRTDRGIRTGQRVSVVSYGAGRNDAPSRQRACDVLQAQSGVVVMSCDVVAGSSGSPVFSLRDGQPRIVSLVSAIGQEHGRQVTYGVDIATPLAKIMADYRAGRGVYPAATFDARRITVGGGTSPGGARFLKP